MKFDDFKEKLLPYLSQGGKFTSRQISQGICPHLEPSYVNGWLKKMVDSGEISRKKDESYIQGMRYVYFSDCSAEPKVVESIPSKDVKQVWVKVLNELTPFMRPLFNANCELRSLNANTALVKIRVPAMTRVVRSRKKDLELAFQYACGYRIQLELIDPDVSDVVDDGLLDVEAGIVNHPAPVVNSIPDDIKSEFTVKPDGSTTITLSGAARLLGISHQGLTKAFTCNQKRSGLAQDLINKGFQPATFGIQGIPDAAFGFIVTYYAYEAGRYCTDQAKAISKAFVGIGMREWIHHELGWQPPKAEIMPKDDKALTENLSALVVSVQGLVTSAQSQQAMIHDQQAALKDVFAGLNQLGMTMQNFGQKISYHDDRIVELSAYVEKLETERQDFKKTVLGVNPTVQAPPKGPRNELIQLVGKFVYLKGLGKDGYGSVWADLYRDIELRCGVMLEVERKKLVANGQKDARKIDAIESLGLMEIAVSIAQEMLRAA